MNQPSRQRKVFFVSDRTGLTAHSYGNSLLAQFPEYEFDSESIAFVDTRDHALAAVEIINQAAASGDEVPIVFSTLVETEVQQIIEQANACVINLFGTFIGPLEDALGVKSAHTLGMSQAVFGSTAYENRLDAIDFTLAHDDGVRPDQYALADVILVGVSRCGKTPTSLFLAMNYSVKAANYPLTEEDFASESLPLALCDHLDKLIGLTISPGQLSNIREHRRPGSQYASLQSCRKEVKLAEEMFRRMNLPFFDSTDTSIEELAGSVIKIVR